jgi:hypothetical protein
MKTEEQKKDLEWSTGFPLDYEVKNLIDPMVSETRAVWAQWWDKHLNGDETYNCGVIKFGLVSSAEIGRKLEVFTVFQGFDEGRPTWEEWDTEYKDLEWCSLSELNKL